MHVDILKGSFIPAPEIRELRDMVRRRPTLMRETTKGNSWLKSALTEAAWAASHTKDTYLSALFHKLVPRLGKKKSLVAIAHVIAIAIYHILTEGVPYYELGSDYFSKQINKKLERRLIRRLEELGYKVTLEIVNPSA